MAIIYRDEVYKIVGAAVAVHKELGPGFLEAVYQEALELEFRQRDIPFSRERLLQIAYKDKVLQKKYIADFVCFDEIILETKSARRITEIEVAQVINYLKASELRLGVLINFGSYPRLEWKRIIK